MNKINNRSKSPPPKLPAAEPAGLPILAELLPRGDGSYVLKPQPLDGHMDSWISTARAAALLGLPRRSLYTLMDPAGPYLVWRRPLKNKIMISLKSVHHFIQATTYPDFWSDQLQQQKLQAMVRAAMAGA